MKTARPGSPHSRRTSWRGQYGNRSRLVLGPPQLHPHRAEPVHLFRMHLPEIWGAVHKRSASRAQSTAENRAIVGGDALMRSKIRSLGRWGFPRVDRVVFALGALFPSKQPPVHVLITAPGGGNIGDQAMFEAFAENSSGRVLAILPSSGALNNPDPGRVETAAMPALMQLTGVRHWVDVWRLGRLVSETRSLSVTGADIMDGGYNPVASVARWNLALCFARKGVPSRLLGFSWNGRSPAIVAAYARAAHDAGVQLFVRDPVSLRRIHADGLPKAVGTSDTVFQLTTNNPAITQREEFERIAGRAFVIVNASALVARGLDQVSELREVIDAILASDRNVVVLPHVQRGPHGDIEEGARVAQGYPADRVIFVDRLLEPSGVRSLTRRAEAVVTGRMHLAIMALSQGTPALVVSTQGKVEGLAELFETPDLLLEPSPGFGATAIERIAPERLDAFRRRVAARLPVVTELASRNFEGVA